MSINHGNSETKFVETSTNASKNHGNFTDASEDMMTVNNYTSDVDKLMLGESSSISLGGEKMLLHSVVTELEKYDDGENVTTPIESVSRSSNGKKTDVDNMDDGHVMKNLNYTNDFFGQQGHLKSKQCQNVKPQTYHTSDHTTYTHATPTKSFQNLRYKSF